MTSIKTSIQTKEKKIQQQEEKVNGKINTINPATEQIINQYDKDLDKAENLSYELQSGLVTVNNIVASDPRVPFGGIKKSGFGRELSRYGMIEFANIKSVRLYDKLVDHHHVE
jgi:acyl-CoA reductase-like NAD-dependent aldehyde dehydrogenase